jgi:stringent starvation protein B
MSQKNPQTSSRPYLLRAMHEWMSDAGVTPLVVVDALFAGVQVPEGHVEDGRIVLNISWSATSNLVMDNEAVSFNARFGGVGHLIYLPIDSLTAIYARESGEGMVFQLQADGEEVVATDAAAPQEQPSSSDDDGPGRPSGPPGLRLVK